MKKTFLLLLTLTLFLLQAMASIVPPRQEYYELRIYTLSNEQQLKTVEDYLQQALIPALKNQGIGTIGVFTPLTNDTASTKKIYLLIPFKSVDQAITYSDKLEKDKNYLDKGKPYIQATFKEVPYYRQERILMKAFKDQPVLKVPSLKNSRSDRVYELRSYEGHTEKIYANKVDMFNRGGEIKLFDRLGFNGIFYAEVLFGSRMPNLVYMTSFENMEERNAHWKTFGNDAEWKSLSSREEYQNNVSHADIWLLRPTEYSDL